MRGTKVIEVLIIEDDVRIAEIQKRYIEKIEGFQTIGIATSYEEAKQSIEILQPALILLDVYFPDMNGIQFLREIKSDYKGIDVMMITATKEIDVIQEAISIGVFDFIIKPVIFERFEQSLRRYEEHYMIMQSLKKENKSVTQLEVDQLLRKQSSSQKSTYYPKGIDRLTLEKVLDVLSGFTIGLTAEQMAKEIGASRTTARRYLEYLISDGKIDADLSYGTVGRPERVYIIKAVVS
ncbi:response regulator [Priestia koreensis]|uniref:Chemotaxis protein CheY n=1 Tax=Priestia koreensis TaxID=284581 RepID=A0A0M0KQR1_9BACI|nr:response regulator [Priestia koreensis]KOO41155.1 chemotaxis protein CheY [Priestia koreensis]